MMPTTKRYFAHAHIRTIVSLFGKLFANVYHSQMNAAGTDIDKLIRVPIRYLPTSRSHIQENEPNTGDDINRFLETYPRMIYAFTSLSYDSSRQVSPHQKHRNPNDNTQVGFSSSPYIIGFDLRILARDNIKGLEIVEQILPFFRPNLTVSIQHPAFDGESHDVVVTLDSVSNEDNFDSSEMRVVEFLLSFSVKTNFQGIVTNSDIEINKFGGEVVGDPNETDPPLYEIVDGTIIKIIVQGLDICVENSLPIWTQIIEPDVP